MGRRRRIEVVVGRGPEPTGGPLATSVPRSPSSRSTGASGPGASPSCGASPTWSWPCGAPCGTGTWPTPTSSAGPGAPARPPRPGSWPGRSTAPTRRTASRAASARSCVEIARGHSLDVHELDAASNNGVDAMRDLVAHAALGTPGRWKVYIVDEVHMLSNAAANALLKTLEEPPGPRGVRAGHHRPPEGPSHDPQPDPALRVPPARCRHPGRAAARRAGPGRPGPRRRGARRWPCGGAAARPATRCRPSTRWPPSGSADDARPELAEVRRGAVATRMPGRLLVAVAALRRGRAGDPSSWPPSWSTTCARRSWSALAPELGRRAGRRARAARSARPTASGWRGWCGPWRCSGRAQVDMRDAPDPRVVLEVALVRLARPSSTTRSPPWPTGWPAVERASAAGHRRRRRRARRPADRPPPSPAAPPAGPTDAGSAGGGKRTRPTLPLPRRGAPPTPAVDGGPAGSGERRTGARAGTGPGSAPARLRRRPRQPPVATAAPPPTGSPVPTATAEPRRRRPPPAAPRPPPPSAHRAARPGHACSSRRGATTCSASLPARAKALFSAGRFVAVEDGAAAFALPNAAHRDRCEDVRPVVEEALAAHFGGRCRCAWWWTTAPTAPAGRPAGSGREPERTG